MTRGLILAVSLCISQLALAQGPGQGLFERTCARCHGGDATGGEAGPNIVSRIIARTDSELTEFIRAGRPQSGMPGFNFGLHETADLLFYLRVLAPSGGPPTALGEIRTVETVSGSKLTGQVINEGGTELQLRTEDKKVQLLRKTRGAEYRSVTSQQDWQNYDGGVNGNRYSEINQINKTNVSRLAVRWVFPVPGIAGVENTPVVLGGLMYVSGVNECWALDAGSGRVVWHYQQPRTKGHYGNASKGIHRGVAAAGDRIFMLTDHAHLLALNRYTGDLLWDAEMADWRENYDGTSAPLIVGDLVVSGIGGGDAGVRGFIAAFSQTTGKEVWRFWTVPLPGEPGSETWIGGEIKHRAGATWLTGSYDPQLESVYWATGNPGPDFDDSERGGDNLYTNSVVALNAKTGALKWYYQFTPHDVYDWDAVEPLVLADLNWRGQRRKVLLQANRNGFFYVLDRTNGQFLLGEKYLKKLTWADKLDAKGRPVSRESSARENGETYVCPGFQGGTNWFSVSFNPLTGLFYFNSLERCMLFAKRTGEWQQGSTYLGGAARAAPGDTPEKLLRAIDVQTGRVVWEVPQTKSPVSASAGVLSTASGLVFFGENSGAFMAVDAVNGRPLWQFQTSVPGRASPMTYMFDNEQHVAMAAGSNVLVFALPK